MIQYRRGCMWLCRLALASTALIVSSAYSSFAIAQPVDLPDDSQSNQQSGDTTPASTDDTADSLFLRAREMMAVKNYPAACEDFERSLLLDYRITTLVNLANCRELNEELATAARLFREAADGLTSVPGGDAATLRSVVAKRIDSLQSRLSGIIVKLPSAPPPGLKILVNGTPIDAVEIGQVIPRDGGMVQLLAIAPGHEPWSKIIKLRNSGDVQTVDVPDLFAADDETPTLERKAPPSLSSGFGAKRAEPERAKRWAFKGAIGAVALSGRLDHLNGNIYRWYSFGWSPKRRETALGIHADVSVSWKHRTYGGFAFRYLFEAARDGGVGGIDSLRSTTGTVRYAAQAMEASYLSPKLKGWLELQTSLSRQTIGVGYDDHINNDLLYTFSIGAKMLFSESISLSWQVSPVSAGDDDAQSGDGIRSQSDARAASWEAALQFSWPRDGSRALYVEAAWKQVDVEYGQRNRLGLQTGHLNVGFAL